MLCESAAISVQILMDHPVEFEGHVVDIQVLELEVLGHVLHQMSHLKAPCLSSSPGLEIAVRGLVTFPFKSCVSQLSVDQISRHFVYF